ncbi:MAG: alpha-mannosidase [Actinobacteria bacterium]|nr:alpha-mannosidase [Actinomycetota bacterium]
MRYKKAQQIGAHVSMECFSRLLPYDERASKDDKYLFIFNPSPYERSDIVETDLEFFLQDVEVGLNPDVKVAPKLPPVDGFRLEDTDGKTIPCQIVSRGEGFGITYSKHDYPNQTLVDRFSILVSAGNVPAMGWKGLKIVKTGAPVQFPPSVHAGENFLENDFLKVEVSSDGAVRILDKLTQTSYERMNIFEDSGDVGDEYNYSYPERDERFESTHFQPVIHIIERGPLRASIQIDQTMVVPASASPDERNRSTGKAELAVSTVLSLTPLSKRLDFKTTVRRRRRP